MICRDSRLRSEKDTDVGIARELESKVEPEDVTEFLQCHSRFQDEVCFPMVEWRKWFSEMDLPGEDVRSLK